MGAWLASDGGLPADLFFADVLNPIVGVSLLAITVRQSTTLWRIELNPLWESGLPAMVVLQPTIFQLSSLNN
ncbi:hypothetical protein PS718_04192 [Pseudomonas fluorescens]|uniref:Uncharacterized protein n=1 Tax=Pseudomonas fluorescens TaxID=294 RepID=A0A5E7DSZ6_PSEFL|nr:hypothetical protein PS718_04192 [Pseudomonas fluorescens]